VSARHTLHLFVEFLPGSAGETALSFPATHFFCRQRDGVPKLLPGVGFFADGRCAAEKMGIERARTGKDSWCTPAVKRRKLHAGNGELIVSLHSEPNDRYPFVVAGRYTSAEIGGGKEKIILWTRKAQEAAGLRGASDALVRTMEA